MEVLIKLPGALSPFIVLGGYMVFIWFIVKFFPGKEQDDDQST